MYFPVVILCILPCESSNYCCHDLMGTARPSACLSPVAHNVRHARKQLHQSTWNFRTMLGPWKSTTGCSSMTSSQLQDSGRHIVSTNRGDTLFWYVAKRDQPNDHRPSAKQAVSLHQWKWKLKQIDCLPRSPVPLILTTFYIQQITILLHHVRHVILATCKLNKDDSCRESTLHFFIST